MIKAQPESINTQISVSFVKRSPCHIPKAKMAKEKKGRGPESPHSTFFKLNQIKMHAILPTWTMPQKRTKDASLVN